MSLEGQNKNKKEKLLYIGAINPCVANGSTIHYFCLGKEFSEHYCVDLVIPKTGKTIAFPFSDFKSKNFNLHEKGSLLKWGFPPSVNLINQIPWILYYILKKKINCVYIRSNITSFMLIALIRFFTRAFVITEHNGFIADESIALGYPKWVGAFAKIAQRWDARMAHLVRVVTPGLKTCLARESGVCSEKIFIAQNGTNIARLYPLARENALEQLNLNRDHLYIGFAGNLVVWQGLKIALSALCHVIKELPEVRFIIAGEGPEKNKLKALAIEMGLSEYVTFLNHVSLEKINIVINAFDIGIAPFLQARNSKIGLSPIKIRDYAAAGRPVIAANIAGISDENTHTWLITHEPDNEEDLAKIIIDTLRNETKRRTMSKAARQYAEKYYQWTVVVEKIIDQINHHSKPHSKPSCAV